MPLTLDQMATASKKQTLDEMAETPQQEIGIDIEPLSFTSTMFLRRTIEDVPIQDPFNKLPFFSDNLKAKMANSAFYSSEFKIDPNTAFDLHDALNRTYLGKDIDSLSALSEIREGYNKNLENDLYNDSAPKPDGWKIPDFGLTEVIQATKELINPPNEYMKREGDEAAKEWYDRLSWWKTYSLSLGGRIGPKGLRQELTEQVESFSGFGPALMPAAGSAAVNAFEWGVIYPKLFAALGVAGEIITQIPKVKSAIKVIESIGGIERFAQKYPKLYISGLRALTGFLKGEIAGQTTVAAESFGKDKTFEEWVVDMNKRGAELGAISTIFSLANSYDQYRYMVNFSRSLKQSAYDRFQERVNAGIDPKISAQMSEFEVRKIEDIIAYQESELLGQKQTLYGGKKPELSAREAANEFIKNGFVPGTAEAEKLAAIKKPQSWLNMESERAKRMMTSNNPEKQKRGQDIYDWLQRLQKTPSAVVKPPEEVKPTPIVAEKPPAAPTGAKITAEPTVPAPEVLPTVAEGKVRQKDLLGRPVLEGGAAGKQTEFLEKEKYRLPEPDIEGQITIPIPAPPVPLEVSVEPEEAILKPTKKVIGNIEREIEKSDIYQMSIEMQDVSGREIGYGGLYYVPRNLRGEVEAAVSKYPALKFHITFDRTKDATDWSKAVQEGLLKKTVGTHGEMDIGEFLDRFGQSLEGKKKLGKLNAKAIEEMENSGDPYSQMLSGKYEMMIQGYSPEEINDFIRDIAVDNDLTEEGIKDILVKEEDYVEAKQKVYRGVEEKAQPSQKEKVPVEQIKGRVKEARQLRQSIHAVATVKGLSKKALTELKKKYTGYTKLTSKQGAKNITVEQLQDLLVAVRQARPKRVGYKKVLTLKAEKRIRFLKDNLTRKLQMTDEAWNDILARETGGKEPKYIDAEHFITQEQSRNVLKRMHNTATLLRITNPYEDAVRRNPEIAKDIAEIETKIKSVEHRDPYSLESMRFYTQQSVLKTGTPMDVVYKKLIDTGLENHRTREAQIKSIEAAVGEEPFAKIVGDEVALKRVSDYIDSKSYLENRPEMPADITDDEVKFAQAIEKILETRRIQARAGKFFNYYYYDQPIAEYDRYKKEIDKAIEIYDTQGEEELMEYLETQEWGIIHSGYDPRELFFRKIRLYSTGPKAVGKGHIQISTAVEFHEQERNIMQRLASYMRQMDILSNVSPLINTYIQLYEDNAEKFDDWNTVKNNVELFLSEVKRYGIEKNWIMRQIKKMFSQAAQTLLQNSISISIYNIAEATAFAADKSVLFDLRNNPLTPEDKEYLETYVQQQRAMLEEFFLVNEPAYPIPGLKQLNKLARMISLTSHTDVISRYHTFWGKINQVRRAMKAGTLTEQLSQAKLKDFTLLEQKMALSILAKDGPEEMAKFLARTESDNVHGRYVRAERSPAEMGSGAVWANLMLFPRMYTERMARNAYVAIFDPTADAETKFRAAKTLVSVIVGATMIGMAIAAITGRRRNPYNPLEIIGWKFGGLIMGGIEALSNLFNKTLEIGSGDERTRKRAIAEWPAAFTKVPEMFIPFYAMEIRALEKVTDTKYIDRLAIRKIVEMLDEDYKTRPDAYEFKKKGLVNAIQYIFIGRSTDVEDEKKRYGEGAARLGGD
jgi:hypothetical protein